MKITVDMNKKALKKLKEAQIIACKKTAMKMLAEKIDAKINKTSTFFICFFLLKLICRKIAYNITSIRCIYNIFTGKKKEQIPVRYLFFVKII